MQHLTKDLRTRGLHETELPIPHDPAALKGVRVLGDDGWLYCSDGSEWRPMLNNEFGDLVVALLGGLHSNVGQISRTATESRNFAASGSPRIIAALADLYSTQSQVARDQAKTKTQSQADAAVREALSMIGQVSKRLDGGRIALNRGDATEPAITIADIGIYASANNALSVAISGIEVARLTPDGLTIYGTITESP